MKFWYSKKKHRK